MASLLEPNLARDPPARPVGLQTKSGKLLQMPWHCILSIARPCCDHTVVAMQARNAAQSQLQQSEAQSETAGVAHEQERRQQQERAAQLEAQLADLQTELGAARLDLETAQAQQEAMSQSVDVVGGSLDEVQSALSMARSDLSATRAALGEMKNAKLTLEARLKASEVRKRRSC
jgi:septal ring factor EnvC (AmiA/AmiB activator)